MDMKAMRLGLLCGLSMGLAAGSAVADPQTDEANRQRQMASMRQEAAKADQASADRSLVQQQNAANAARQGANSGKTPGSGLVRRRDSQPSRSAAAAARFTVVSAIGLKRRSVMPKYSSWFVAHQSVVAMRTGSALDEPVAA